MHASFNHFPQFEGCCTLLKGPSRTFWFCHYNLFDDCVGINIDEATKKAMCRDDLAIKNNETRTWSYHLFVWPVGIAFDNNIFSGNLDVCKRSNHPLVLPSDHVSNSFRTKMNSFVIIWTIGLCGGHRTRDGDDDGDVDLTSMFG